MGPSETMSGAADGSADEHLGILGWTTECWDIVLAETGHRQSTHFWYTGPTDDEALAVLRRVRPSARGPGRAAVRRRERRHT